MCAAGVVATPLCVAPIVELGTGAVLGRGQLLNLPIHLASGDGLLDWPSFATYQLGDTAADLPHRLSFQQELTPASSRWHEAFGGFELARHTERILLRFGARYSVAADYPHHGSSFDRARARTSHGQGDVRWSLCRTRLSSFASS